MIYLLMLCLLLILYLSYRLNGNDLLCPSFLFSGAFAFSSLWACFYAQAWELGLHANTFFVILGGTIEFTGIATGLRYLYLRNTRYLGKHQNHPFTAARIPKWISWAVVLFALFTIYATARFLTNWANLPLHQFIKAGNLYDLLKFRLIRTFSFPATLSRCRLVVDACAYYFGYIAVNEWLEKQKISYVSWGIVALGIGNSLLLGARGGAVNILLALVFFFLFLYEKKIEKVTTWNLKIVFYVGAFVFLLLGTFRLSAIVMGRGVSKNWIDYLALYLGAEIKNLDIFLQRSWANPRLWGSQTFIMLIKSIGRHLGWNVAYQLDLPQQIVNGFGLGNVYTLFYPFIYDFGYFGWLLPIAIMASVTEGVYLLAKYSKNLSLSHLCTLCYGGMFSSILFSFFSNKFYENHFSVTYLKMIIYFMILEVIIHFLARQKKSLPQGERYGKSGI